MYPGIVPAIREDRFGTEERLAAIQEVLNGRELGHIIDLGGNAGYFSLSLIDSGMASGSTVYDHSADALAVGRLVAKELGLQDKIAFKPHEISLEFVRALEPSDTVICLNVIHHAGSHFDVEAVTQAGWEDYARQWLQELRTKTRLAILGVGFKKKKPRHWEIAAGERTRRFYDLASETGWHVAYDANIEDLHSLGTQKADGLRTRGSVGSGSAEAPGEAVEGANQPEPESLKSKYHLYILQNDESVR
jgi:hypothetical protein